MVTNAKNRVLCEVVPFSYPLLLEVIRTMFFLLSWSACLKKISMLGALGNIWRHKFHMGTQNDMNLER